MDLKNVLAQLHEERDTLDSAISSLERLEQGRHRGPGRPPGLTAKSPSTNGTNSSNGTNGANRVDGVPNLPFGEG